MAVKKEKNIASKTSMNLAIRENTWLKSAWVAPVAVVIVLAAVLVAKFGVADRLAQVAAAQREVDNIRAQTEALRAAFADYDEVEAQYNQYTYKDFDRTLADRMDILALLEREIFPVCQVQRMALAEKRLDLAMEGLTLENTSGLINRLKADKLVSEVFVSTATTTEDNGAVHRTTEMTILLADAVEQEAQGKEADG